MGYRACALCGRVMYRASAMRARRGTVRGSSGAGRYAAQLRAILAANQAGQAGNLRGQKRLTYADPVGNSVNYVTVLRCSGCNRLAVQAKWEPSKQRHSRNPRSQVDHAGGPGRPRTPARQRTWGNADVVRRPPSSGNTVRTSRQACRLPVTGRCTAKHGTGQARLSRYGRVLFRTPDEIGRSKPWLN